MLLASMLVDGAPAVFISAGCRNTDDGSCLNNRPTLLRAEQLGNFRASSSAVSTKQQEHWPSSGVLQLSAVCCIGMERSLMRCCSAAIHSSDAAALSALYDVTGGHSRKRSEGWTTLNGAGTVFCNTGGSWQNNTT